MTDNEQTAEKDTGLDDASMGDFRSMAAALVRVEAVLDACESRLERSPDRVLAFWLREVRAALADQPIPPAQPEASQ